MSDFMKEAQKRFSEMQADRRWLHAHAEAGLHLPETTAYLLKRLKEMGLEPVEICDSGLSCLIGGKKGGKTILLRADTDALLMPEDNDLPFKSTTDAAHNCGHDLHMTMLLGAAAMLKEHEGELEGTVKLMFQPGEEGLSGARVMIDAGILDNPKVDAAMALHVMPEELPGALCYTKGVILSSADSFNITIQGKGTHGSSPNLGVDPINVAVHLHMAYQSLMAREISPIDSAVLTIGKFRSGEVNNILPETAELGGTLRTYSNELREYLVKRMADIAEGVGWTFRAKVDFKVPASVPVTFNNPALVDEFVSYINKLDYPFRKHPDYVSTASEDFSYVGQAVPAVMFMLGAKTPGNEASLHNPGVLLNEETMPLGAALLAQCAFEWLKNNK